MSTLAFDSTQWLITPEGETADALGYSVGSSWTRIYSLPGRTGFTAHFIKLAALAKQLPISRAFFRLVFQSSDPNQVSARIIALSYVNGVAVWADDWGAFQRRAIYNPDNQGVDVTAKLKALLASGATDPQIGIEVFGTGVIHEATLEVVYAIPDHSEAIAALEARIEALEAAAAPAPVTFHLPPGGLTITIAG